MYKYLQSLEKFGINLGLNRIICLLNKLDNPHQKFQSIHIAGTNGKGSTAATIASILTESGYKVGLYTSPHLFDYRERIKFKGKNISRKEFKEGLSRVQKSAKGLEESPTIFEVLTAVAFWYFAKKKVDYAVVEVGMGGRLDATNIISPLVSVITNIDYEHTEVLGKTLSKIAREKAAIIKPGVSVVTAENKAEPLKVIEKTCRANNSKLLVIEGQKPRQTNTACSLSALLLAEIKVSKSAIKRGLKKVSWPGRFQILSKNPLVIVDGAHNPAGAKALRVTIEELYPGKKFALIFGMQATKNHLKTLNELLPVIRSVIITCSSHKQACDPTCMYSKFKKKIPRQIALSVKDALNNWDRKTPLLITGSLFLIADALQLNL